MRQLLLAAPLAGLSVWGYARPAAAAVVSYGVNGRSFFGGYGLDKRPNGRPYLRGGDPAANDYLNVVREIQRCNLTNRARSELDSHCSTPPRRPDLPEDPLKQPPIRALPPTGRAANGTYFRSFNRR